MKLNLGCGRVHFPLQPDQALTPELREHLRDMPETCYAPGWVNVDKYPLPGVDEAIDLFRFPWVRSSNGNPFNDDSVDEMWAGHILEHVPHQVRLAAGLPRSIGGSLDYGQLVENLDGLFVFFAEVYRLLKPNGQIRIRCPFGVSYAALSDPTHTRYITPGTFGYFAAEGREDAPFDYRLPFDFQMVGAYELRFTSRWMGEAAKYSQAGIEDLMMKYANVVDEIRITLRAVKE